jgi:NAD(P)-dependent dehydrogenase (short-subunit alcohol dehydrogenase family)
VTAVENAGAAVGGEARLDLAGKVAIVTGASAGVGRAYALALAAAGATVIAAARTLGDVTGDVAGRNTLAEVVQSGELLAGRIHARVCDVEVETDIARTIDETAANFGRIDVLVNNAGIMTPFDPFGLSCEDWDRVMRVNVRAPYLAMRQAAPYMIRERSGSIINVTARAGAFVPKGNRGQGSVVYAASKAALNRLSFFMSEELKPYGIAVNALSPGVVLTDTALALNPKLGESRRAKPPTPDALGPALVCLAQQTAETLTGQILHTDEFQTSWP